MCIRDRENFFLFGNREEEIAELWKNGYDPQHYIGTEVGEAMNLVRCGHFSGGDRDIFLPLLDNICYHDPFFVMADFEDYIRTQDEVSSHWTKRDEWNRMSLLNISNSGFFSSDRSILDYCNKIWSISNENSK